jgi:hypothetical protein
VAHWAKYLTFIPFEIRWSIPEVAHCARMPDAHAKIRAYVLDFAMYNCSFAYSTTPCTRLLQQFLTLTAPADAGGEGSDEVEYVIPPPVSRSRSLPPGKAVTMRFDGGTEG